MSKFLKRWDVIYERETEKYLPGDTVRGKMVVEISKTLILSKMKVRFKGKAEVTMFIGDYDTQRVGYFNQEKILFQCPEGSKSVSLLPGFYEYPFKFTLPPDLPYSFISEGDENANIIFFIRATIYRPGKYTLVYDKPFKVECIVDLNSLQNMDEKIQNIKIKSLTCLTCKLGDIIASVIVLRKGYVPGEEIIVSATIDNRSKRRVKRTKVQLLQVVTMTVYGSSSIRENKVSERKFGAVLPGSTYEINGEAVSIPSNLPPSSLKKCELIEVAYRLEVLVFPVGLCRKLRVPLDVVLGTVPLHKPDHTDPIPPPPPPPKEAVTNKSHNEIYGTSV